MKRIYYALLLGFCHVLHLVSPKRRMYQPADNDISREFRDPF